MKKLIAVTLLSSAAAMAAVTASANSAGSSYVGVLASHYSYEESGYSEELNPTGLTLRGGHFLTDNFAVEGRLGTGLNDDTVSGTNVDVELDQVVGVYAVGHLPVSDVFSFYGLLGFSYAEATLSVPGASVSGDDDGFSYGAGVEVNFTPAISGQLEYVSYLDKSDYELNAASLGLSYNF
jgi:outer membrane autotransporter protein